MTGHIAKKYPHENIDSHSHICAHYRLNEDLCNEYEFNPLIKRFKTASSNSAIDDRLQAEDWVNNLDFGKIVKPLIIKPIINPFKLPVPEITQEDIKDLKKWASVWTFVKDSVWASVYGYVSSFFRIPYEYDFSSVVRLWERGIVPSFDGQIWRLHAGKDAHVIYTMESEK